MNLKTIKEIAKDWTVSESRIRQLLLQGRISSAKKVGNLWLIPKNAKDPRKVPGWTLGRKRNTNPTHRKKI